MAERKYNYKKNMTISKAVADRTKKKKASQSKGNVGIRASKRRTMMSGTRSTWTSASDKKRTAGEPLNRTASDRRLRNAQREMFTRTPARSKGEPANRGKTSRGSSKNRPGYGVRTNQSRNVKTGYGDPPSRTKSRKTPTRSRLRLSRKVR